MLPPLTVNRLELLTTFVRTVFPKVKSQLNFWSERASQCGDPELRRQALASIKDKRFHCLGGSVYSLYPGVPMDRLIALIVALQTISDYLDNLCDRAGVTDEAAFRQLHLAMTDALQPTQPLHDYYAAYPLKDDGGYLRELVCACRREIAGLPSYEKVQAELLRFAALYSQLQTYKHVASICREEKMLHWLQNHTTDYPELGPWEFAAATGSTLSMFMLFAAAADPHLTDCTVRQLSRAYFPWINGLHILLDYLIDADEDHAGGDLNFTFYYADQQQTAERLLLFTAQAFSAASQLPCPLFHRTVVQGLLAMYLSDPKTAPPVQAGIARQLLDSAGAFTRFLYRSCRLLRRLRTL